MVERLMKAILAAPVDAFIDLHYGVRPNGVPGFTVLSQHPDDWRPHDASK
jgi:hypothetical protein